MKKQNMTKQLLALILVVGLITSQGIVVNAAESDEVQFDASFGSESGKVIAVIMTYPYSFGEKNFEIQLKYYNMWHDHLSSKTFVEENTMQLLIDDVPPEYADHALVRFYSNDVQLGQKWVYIKN